MFFQLAITCAGVAGCGGETGADPPVRPVEPAIVAKATEDTGVEWIELTAGSLRFLGIMHAFRLLTEPGTRSGGFGMGTGYTKSVTNLHGWADGDPFYVNYVGHPMQGAVSGRLWLLNDRRYRRAEFGKSAAYWKGRLRATAFAWAFSEQFELGPLSEASIGHIQKDFPQQGFVDHVITPTIGLSWILAEDALDRYVIKGIEAHTQNRYARSAARTFLNPARSFANVVAWKAPWYRDSRPGVMEYVAPSIESRVRAAPAALNPMERSQDTASFEFTAVTGARQVGGSTCVGGGAEGAVQVNPEWQMVLAVNGCKKIGQRENVSGDALVYQLGPRWTPSPEGKWSPFAQLLVGGLKTTQETMDPLEKQRVLNAHKDLDPMLDYTLHGKYTTQQESNALALSAGMGVDYRLNPALAIRVASVEYLRSKAGAISGSGFQMTTGMVLRWGTW